jgi:hypothetical protein
VHRPTGSAQRLEFSTMVQNVVLKSSIVIVTDCVRKLSEETTASRFDISW